MLRFGVLFKAVGRGLQIVGEFAESFGEAIQAWTGDPEVTGGLLVVLLVISRYWPRGALGVLIAFVLFSDDASRVNSSSPELILQEAYGTSDSVNGTESSGGHFLASQFFSLVGHFLGLQPPP